MDSANVDMDEKREEMIIDRKKIISEIQESQVLIANKMDIKNAKFDFSKMETSKIGSDYLSYVNSDKWNIMFHIRTNCLGQDLDNINKVSYFLEIKNKWGMDIYFKDEEFEDIGGYVLGKKQSIKEQTKKITFPKEWIFKNLKKFLELKIKDPITFYFGYSRVKVLGDIGISNSSFAALQVDLRGIASLRNEILIYKIEHEGKEEYNTYSYAVYHDFFGGISNNSWWTLFPDFCGGGGGTGNYVLKQVDEMINSLSKKKKIELINIKIKSYDLIKAFVNDLNIKKEEIKMVSSKQQNSERLKRMEKKIDLLSQDHKRMQKSLDEISSKINIKNIDKIIEETLKRIKDKDEKNILKRIKDTTDNMQRIEKFIEWSKLASPIIKTIINSVITFLT